jgi:DNA-directed RNA polymerase subunit RPC12/RpoP
MNKNCEECGKEFPITVTRGNEQKYCSHKCRAKAGNKRNEQRLIERYKKQNENNNEQETERKFERINGSINHSNDSSSYEMPIRHGYEMATKRENMDVHNSIYLIERNFETKSELIEFKLRNEYLMKENEELKRQIANLEVELLELEGEDEEPEKNDWIGGVVQQFKTDPVNTISFTTELINGLLKPKTNEKL